MNTIGRNDRCHCGSGKKYKKCCLRKDEEERSFEQAIEAGEIDRFAGDEEWEDEPADNMDEEPEDQWDDDDDYEEFDDLESLQPSKDEVVAEAPKKLLSDTEQEVINDWWKVAKQISDPDELLGHSEKFMLSHPELVAELGFEGEVMFELRDMYVLQDRHQEYINILSRLRTEFQETYLKGFAYFDMDMVAWLVMNGQRADVSEYLTNFRADPSYDPDLLFATIYFMMSWNCQEILADFIPAICHEVCTSPAIHGGDEIINSMVVLIMAPFLDQGLDGYDVQELTEELVKIGDGVNQLWTDPEFLKDRFDCILGIHERWSLDGCDTRSQAVRRYYQMTSNFMGWLVAHKNLDWCAADYHRQFVFDYLVAALPEKRKPRDQFPFAEKSMDVLMGNLSRGMFRVSSTKLFGLLNGAYWFLEFLENTMSLDAKQASQGRAACVRIFEDIYPSHRKHDFYALAWEQFPRQG